ncbi:hypothetical protein AB0C77_23575 [Streptomyces sp. NPDC048629]|uniref:hypothetical protein n=1 Tax=Streptomyces sp. NPDC048629 TaxID=3154824 RepID=UPI003447BBC2
MRVGKRAGWPRISWSRPRRLCTEDADDGTQLVATLNRDPILPATIHEAAWSLLVLVLVRGSHDLGGVRRPDAWDLANPSSQHSPRRTAAAVPIVVNRG